MTHREFPVPGPVGDPQRPLVINYRAPYQSPSTDIDDEYRSSTCLVPICMYESSSDVNMYFGFSYFEP